MKGLLPLALGSALLCAACTPEDDDPAPPPPGDADGAKLDDPSGPLPVFAASYGLLLDSTVKVRDLSEDSTAFLRTRAVSVVSVAQDGARLDLRIWPCHIALPAIGEYQPTLDDAVLSGIEVKARGKLAPQGGKIALYVDPSALVLGARLDNARTDPLPEDIDDPAVVDEDLDGKPGVSIAIDGWRLFAALRVVFALRAYVGRTDLIAGMADVTSDRHIYGDTIPFFDAEAADAEAAANSEVVAQDHRFRLVAGPKTCAAAARALP